MLAGLVVVPAYAGPAYAGRTPQPAQQPAQQPGQQPAQQPAQQPGQPNQPGGQQPDPEPEPEEPPPDTEPPPVPAVGQAVVDPGGRITLPVLAEARSRLELADADGLVVAARATGDAQELTWRVRTGSYDYALTATDKEGNRSEPAEFSLEVDADPPELTRLQLEPGTPRNPLSTIAFVTEPETTYSLLVDGEQVATGTTPAGGTERIEQTLDLADGRYPVVVRLEDETGNRTRESDTLVVDIPGLFVTADLDSEPVDAEQVVEIRATPGTRGTLRVPGEPERAFDVSERGTAEVRLPLEDGDYEGVKVVVRDAQGRRGTATVPAFSVDTTPAELSASVVASAAEEGRLVLEVNADEGSVVDWRVLDATGDQVTEGTFVATVGPETIERDLDEGRYTVELSTIDAYDRVTEQVVEADVAADPVPWTTWLLAAVVLLLVLLALGYLLLRALRRRRERRAARAAAGPDPGSAESLAAYEAAEAAWIAQHQALSRLAQVARGDVPDDLTLPAGFELLPGEKAVWTSGARLLHVAESGGREVALESDAGDLVVTDQRLAFLGEQRRDWWLSLVERVRHLDHERTLVTDGAGLSGVAYDEAGVTRQYVDLVLAQGQGTSYAGVVDRGLRDHEMRRPTPPA